MYAGARVESARARAPEDGESFMTSARVRCTLRRLPRPHSTSVRAGSRETQNVGKFWQALTALQLRDQPPVHAHLVKTHLARVLHDARLCHAIELAVAQRDVVHRRLWQTL